jgi:hypothetical protein
MPWWALGGLVGLDDGVVPLGDVLEVGEAPNTSSIGPRIITVFSKVATGRSSFSGPSAALGSQLGVQ